MENYAKLMFTEDVQKEQAAANMKERFQHVYKNRFTGPLDDTTKSFIETATSFYMATVSQTNWPYVQHRGGPAGFLKVIGDETLGFADYLGNKQFISKGNRTNNDRVSVILMDYPRQARLKLIGHMTLVGAERDPELVEKVKIAGEGPVERVAKIQLAALDWNCPKYIEPRYTQNEVAALVGPQLAKRDATIERLKAQLVALGVAPDTV